MEAFSTTITYQPDHSDYSQSSSLMYLSKLAKIRAWIVEANQRKTRLKNGYFPFFANTKKNKLGSSPQYICAKMCGWS